MNYHDPILAPGTYLSVSVLVNRPNLNSPELNGRTLIAPLSVEFVDLAHDALLELAVCLTFLALPLWGRHVLPGALTQGYKGVGLQGHGGDTLRSEVDGEEDQIFSILKEVDVQLTISAGDIEPAHVPIGHEGITKVVALALSVVASVDIPFQGITMVKLDELSQSEAVKFDLKEQKKL